MLILFNNKQFKANKIIFELRIMKEYNDGTATQYIVSYL
jgi:hypothetical protein